MVAVILSIAAATGSAPSWGAMPGEDGLPALRVPDALGVNIHFTGAPEPELHLLQDGGFRFIRMDFDWNAIEKARGRYNFETYDHLVSILRGHGIRPLFILDYANDLYDGGKSPHDREGWDAYARFAAASARHYRRDGVVWELWNEPNGFWTPKPDAAAYAAMAVRAAAAMRHSERHATILAPGMSGMDFGFFEVCCRAGLLDNLTAVSVHPYRGGPPETVIPDYARLRAMIRQYAPGHRELPVVSSEWGYTAATMPDHLQAAYLAREWLTNLAEGIRLSVWYDWHNDGPDPKNGEHNFGTVALDFTPKEAYRAAQTLTHTLDGFAPVRRLAAGPDVQSLLFRRGRQIRLAVWTAHGPAPVTIPAAAPIPVVSMLGEQTQLQPVAGSVTFTASGSPQYLDLTDQAWGQIQASWSAEPESVRVQSGASIPVMVTLANPMPDAATAVLTLRRPDGSAAHAPVRVRLQPGEPSTLSPGSIRRTDRTEAEQTWRVEIDLDRLRMFRTISTWVTDPMSLDLAPAGAGKTAAIVFNPAGEPFAGTIEASLGGGVPVVMAIQIPAGNTEGRVLLASDFPGSGVPVTLTLRQGRIGPVVLQTRLRFAWLAGFAPGEPDPAGRYTASLDGDPAVAGTARVEPGAQLPAAPGRSFALAYRFAQGWKFAQVRGPQDILEGRPRALEYWLFSDGSNNAVRARLRDASGQTFQPGARDPMAAKGWRWVSLPLNDPTVGSWGGAGDAEIHYPLSWDTVFLVDDTAQDQESHLTGMSDAVLEYDDSTPP